MKNRIYILLFLLTPLLSISQNQNLPLNREFGLVNHKVFNALENNIHTSFQPINQTFLNTISDSILTKSEKQFYGINISKSEKKPRNFFGWMWKSFAYDNFLVVDTGNFYLTVDPLFNIELGKELDNSNPNTLYKNTRGVMIRANVGKKFSFETSLYENQMVLPNYQSNYVSSTGVVPGQGRVKRFKNNGYDFSSSAATISFTPSKHFNFQLGTGKNFIGDGYRSLLLSDASFNYPFWKIIGAFGKNNQFQYTKLNASLSSITRRDPGSTSEALFQRKTMSTHYFSWLATKWLNVGLFESTLWQTEDSSGTKPLQWQQFNPIIGVNTVTTGFNNVNHSVIGTNIKIKLPLKSILYNQLLFDGSSRYGYQIGIKFSAVPYVTLQVEYNNIATDTYSSDVKLQAYSNYNEPLAHPSGNDFNELLFIINSKYKRLFFQAKAVLSKTNKSSIRWSSNNIKTDFHLGYLINPKNNMSIFIGESIRSNGNSTFVYFGFRTSLRNLYSDF